MKNYNILWEKINELSFREVCSWLDISVSRNTIQCPNPKHEDKNPSCKIKDDSFCHCFACGFGGGPVKLIQAKLNMSKWDAIRYINRHVKVLEVLNDLDEKELYLSPWELGCLELKDDPLLTYTFKVPVQEEKQKTKTGTLPKTEAYEIITDRYITYCPTEKMFLSQYKKYVSTILQEIDSNTTRFKNPTNELWKYSSTDAFQKALKEYEIKTASYFFNKTGLKYEPLRNWHLENRNHIIDAAIKRVGSKHYQEFQNKMDQISNLLEEQEESLKENIEQEEEAAYGRKSYTTMV